MIKRSQPGGEEFKKLIVYSSLMNFFLFYTLFIRYGEMLWIMFESHLAHESEMKKNFLFVNLQIPLPLFYMFSFMGVEGGAISITDFPFFLGNKYIY